MPDSFVHLHLHTEFSLLHGMADTGALAERTREHRMPAVAMTNAGHLCGVVEFDQACRARGIKPIFGCEITLDHHPAEDPTDPPAVSHPSRLVLLAKNDNGWRNLVQLASGGRLDGLHRGGPPVRRDTLARHASGLVCLTGAAAGPLNRALAAGDEERARRTLDELREIFGPDDTWIELHDHEARGPRKAITTLLDIARAAGLRVVAANDVRFLDRDDHPAHEVLTCLGTGARLTDPRRPRGPAEAWFKGAEEMRALFHDVAGACDATLEIAAKCDVRLALPTPGWPAFPQWRSADGASPDECLRRSCREGIVKTYVGRRSPDRGLTERLDRELAIIAEFGLASLFLIVAELVRWARANDIPVGPGSGALPGSLVAHVTGITDLCPLRSGLNFERFFNPARPNTPPSFGIEVCPERRGELLAHLRRQYGEGSIAQVIHFERADPRSHVLDVARAMGLSRQDADRLAALVDPDRKGPGGLLDLVGRPLARHLEWNRPPRETDASSPVVRALWSHAVKLGRLPRGAEVRPEEVLIGNGPLVGQVPLVRGPDDGWVSQFESRSLTALGLFRLDLRGLRELTVIREAERQVARRIAGFSIRAVPPDDPDTFAMLGRGHSTGVFLLDPADMPALCRKLQPHNIDDLAVLIACYRPGALMLLDEIIRIAKGERQPDQPHPLLREVCAATGGVPIYQEQVQQAVATLAGLTMAEGDLLRRCIGKRRTSEMDAWRERFIGGCAALHGIDGESAARIFDWIANHAGYAFSKAHAACQARITYWSAFLKARHPAEFMAAALSRRNQPHGRTGALVVEARRLGLTILPPDANLSPLRFAPEPMPSGAPAIRCGLAAIRHAGEERMARVVAEREARGPFASLDDFTRRLGPEVANRRILGLLVTSGAFDWTGAARAAMCCQLEGIAHPPDLPEWPGEQRLAAERLLLGFYCHAHPLDRYRGVVDSPRHLELGRLDEIDWRQRDQRREFAGMVRTPRIQTDKDGKPSAAFVLEDFTGSAAVILEGPVLPRARAAGLLESGRVIRLGATLCRHEETGEATLVGHELGALQPAERNVEVPAEP